MKILDRYILTTFIQTFLSVFVILFFIFILQGIWLFIAELAGKDLDTFAVIKFLMFYSPKVVPMVLPLSVLLASIMVFGNFAENYEFAAMKSSGISLRRAMRNLTYFIFGLGLTSFFFANNIIPKAEFEFINLRRNIMQLKPSMAIAEGQFNNVGNYNIKVDKKYGNEGRLLKNITIHGVSKLGTGVSVVIKAERGELISSEDSNFLNLVLYNGNYYEDIEPKKFEDRKKVPFAKSSFKRYVIIFDLTPKELVQDDKITNTSGMLNIRELRYTLDSLQRNKKEEVATFSENIHNRLTILNTFTPQTEAKKDTVITDVMAILSDQQKAAVIEIARSNITNLKYSIESSKMDIEGKTKNINSHLLSLHEKFVLGYACLLMFFIGAPLGAIIRKGGLGLPIVFAVVIFIVYHFMNVFGKKFAQEDGIPPFLGAWLSSFIFTPLAIVLTYRATNDIGLMQIDHIMDPVNKLIKRLFQKNKKHESA